MCLRPATPGFLITLAATVCLVVVCFSVPWFKTVYFLQVSLAVENMSGDVTFGTLGYCMELPGNTTCTSPKIGYQFDPAQLNQLLGLDGAIQIPSLFVSWLTYPLVLHIVGLVLAAIAALFGLLAHVREMSMTCFSTCFSGFAATIVLIAFIFDLVIFFLARARMNSVSGGSATIGNAVWLTLAAWLLLFFAGCAFGFGRCCVSRRPAPSSKYMGEPDQSYGQAIRLEAIKAESDRRARQQTEVGLPAFPVLQDVESQPLSAAKQEPEYEYLKEEDEEASQESYRDRTPSPSRHQTTADLAAANPLQTLNAPYQPIFRPETSAPLQPFAAAGAQRPDDVGSFGAMPGVRAGPKTYDDSNYTPAGMGYNGGYAYPAPDHHFPPYNQDMQGMPEPMPVSHDYGTAGATRVDEHAPYVSQDTAAPVAYYSSPGVVNANDYVNPYSSRMNQTYEYPNAASTRYGPSGGRPRTDLSGYQEESVHRSPTYQSPTHQSPVYQNADTYRSPYLPQPESRAGR